MSLALCRAQFHPSNLPHLLTGRNPEENPEAMEEFKKFIQRMELQEKNMFVPEIRGESRNAHASLSVPYVTLDCLSPTHVCVCAFCVLSLPGPIVPYVLFHISPCACVPLWYPHNIPSVTHNSMSQRGHSVFVTLCVPMTSKSPVLLLQCLPRSLCIPGLCTVCPFQIP